MQSFVDVFSLNATSEYGTSHIRRPLGIDVLQGSTPYVEGEQVISHVVLEAQDDAFKITENF